MGAGFGPNEGSVRGTVLEESLYSRGNYLDDTEGVADTLRNFPRDRATAAGRSPDRWFKPVLDGVLSSLKGSKNFGALDRSVHTQLHKAQKNRHFGETFKRVQHFMEDASRAALRPVELAPTRRALATQLLLDQLAKIKPHNKPRPKVPSSPLPA